MHAYHRCENRIEIPSQVRNVGSKLRLPELELWVRSENVIETITIKVNISVQLIMAATFHRMEAFMDPNHELKGHEVSDGDGMFYVSGFKNKGVGVILLPDESGWAGGRVRNIADFIAANGFHCIIPNFPALVAHQRRTSSVMPSGSETHHEDRISSTFPNEEAMMLSAISHLHNECIFRISLISFEW